MLWLTVTTRVLHGLCVISTASVCNPLLVLARDICSTTRLYSAFHVGSRWKIRDWSGLSSVLRPRQLSRLYGRRFLQVKRPNQQYQRTEGTAGKYTTEDKLKTLTIHKKLNSCRRQC